jgi:hypothetical protein
MPNKQRTQAKWYFASGLSLQHRRHSIETRSLQASPKLAAGANAEMLDVFIGGTGARREFPTVSHQNAGGRRD